MSAKSDVERDEWIVALRKNVKHFGESFSASIYAEIGNYKENISDNSRGVYAQVEVNTHHSEPRNEKANDSNVCSEYEEIGKAKHPSLRFESDSSFDDASGTSFEDDKGGRGRYTSSSSSDSSYMMDKSAEVPGLRHITTTGTNANYMVPNQGAIRNFSCYEEEIKEEHEDSCEGKSRSSSVFSETEQFLLELNSEAGTDIVGNSEAGTDMVGNSETGTDMVGNGMKIIRNKNRAHSEGDVDRSCRPVSIGRTYSRGVRVHSMLQGLTLTHINEKPENGMQSLYAGLEKVLSEFDIDEEEEDEEDGVEKQLTPFELPKPSNGEELFAFDEIKSLLGELSAPELNLDTFKVREYYGLKREVNDDYPAISLLSRYLEWV